MAHKKQRILIVDLSEHFGGVDTRVVDMAMNLKDRCDIAVIVLQGSQVAKRLQDCGVRICSIRRSKYDPRIVFDIVRIAREFQADVIDAHNPQSQLWGAVAAKLSSVPTAIATVHSVYGVAHKGFLRQHALEGVILLCRILGLKFIVVSKELQDYLISLGVAPSLITLSYNGVSQSPCYSQHMSIRKSLGISEKQFLVGMIGRIEKVKGYDILISAIAQLRERGCNIQAVVVGKGTEENDLRRSIEKARLGSQVHVLGFRKNVAAVMAELDALCMPSRSEGLPYTALEAARAGLPIIATRVGGLPEVFVDRETALLVPPNDVDAIAEALEELARDAHLRSRLGKSAAEFAIERFSVEHMVSETLAVYGTGR